MARRRGTALVFLRSPLELMSWIPYSGGIRTMGTDIGMFSVCSLEGPKFND
jgi:hypothetical protein